MKYSGTNDLLYVIQRLNDELTKFWKVSDSYISQSRPDLITAFRRLRSECMQESARQQNLQPADIPEFIVDLQVRYEDKFNGMIRCPSPQQKLEQLNQDEQLTIMAIQKRIGELKRSDIQKEFEQLLFHYKLECEDTFKNFSGDLSSRYQERERLYDSFRKKVNQILRKPQSFLQWLGL